MNSLAAENQASPIALFSEDGKHWKQPGGGETPIEWQCDERVTRLVIGSLDEFDEDASKETEKTVDGESVPLPGNLADIFPNLTHLHLWRQPLKEIPVLPEKLLELDLRFCNSLISIPQLPESLRNLDLGACERLKVVRHCPDSLRRIYINDCKALGSISFGHCEELVELNASRCPAIFAIEALPRSLKKLVLEGCPNLGHIDSLEEFSLLSHLNLAACPKLTGIPEIPDQLQYLAIYDNEQLNVYRNQDIGPYDRGTKEEPNVADRLYVRKVFGGEISPAAQSKLLLLGDGRVGKTTLSKALQWHTLSGEQQQCDEFSHLKPRKDEPFTQKVQFGRWDTTLLLDEDSSAKLNERARQSSLDVICNHKHECDGAIRLWDFAGQEMYHQTHRLFASEGSVFLIVWSAQDTAKEIDSSRPDSIPEHEWKEMNRPRSLDYWVDYIYSINADAEIAFVCTNCEGDNRPALDERFSAASDSNIPCFYLTELVDADYNYADFSGLIRFVKRACGKEAQRIGIMQPLLYSTVRDHVDDLLKDNVAARLDPTRSPQHLLKPMHAWSELVNTLHGKNLKPHYLSAITGYLHDSGILYLIDDNENSSVMLDQSWAAEIIYDMLRPPRTDHDPCLFNRIRSGNGLFSSDDLEASESWQAIDSESSRSLLLQYIQDAGLFVRVLDRASSRREDEDLYLATEKWLLRDYKLLDLADTYDRIREAAASGERHFSFDEPLVGEFDFRSLMAHIARTFRMRASFFRNGVQITDESAGYMWSFIIQWQPVDSFAYFGRINVRLAAPSDQLDIYQKEITGLLHDNGRKPQDQEVKVSVLSDVEAARRWSLFETDFDIAISSSGKDMDLAQPVFDELRSEGYKIKWYKERQGEPLEKILDLMKSLARQKILLVIASDDYLSPDPNNFYCVYELADALLELEGGRRALDSTFVIYKKDVDNEQNVSRENILEKIEDALGQMDEYFLQKASSQESSSVNRKNYRWLANQFNLASHTSIREELVATFGSTGRSPWIARNGADYDFSVLISEIKNVFSK